MNAGVAGSTSSQVSLRQPKATVSAASNIDKPEKKSDNVSFVAMFAQRLVCRDVSAG